MLSSIRLDDSLLVPKSTSELFFLLYSSTVPTVAETASLVSQIDCVRNASEADKKFPDLSGLLDDLTPSRRSKLGSTIAQDAHLEIYFRITKSRNKDLKCRDNVSDEELKNAAFPAEFVKLERQLTL